MLRGFRHTLFLMLQIGVVVSAGVALAVRPDAASAIAICTIGSLLASLICERVAAKYLKRTLGRLRRVADDIGHGRTTGTLAAQPGEDFYKLVGAINLLAGRLSEANQEEKRLQEQLRRNERLAFLGELAATVAHEVNNPLDGVQNCARILRRSLDDPQRARHMLDLIDGGLNRLELIVRRLLMLAREQELRPTEDRVSRVLESAIEATTARLERQSVRVVRRDWTDDDRAMVDAQLLEQVFINLIINAIDAMPRGGTLTLTVRRESAELAGSAPNGARICVDVADEGAGIAPDVLPHIFEPFFTTKPGGKGTGIGLPIAARIVDAHGGTIRVGAGGTGGAVLTVLIPALPQPAPGGSAGPREAVARPAAVAPEAT